MLVLSRRVGERIVATVPPSSTGHVIVFEICDLREGGKVRCGIDAAIDVAVHREEVLQRIEEERDGKANGGG